MILPMTMAMMWIGCISVRQGQTARPLGAGVTQVAVDGGALLVPQAGAGGIPTGNLGVRVGVSDHVDVLAEIGNLGVGFGMKAGFQPEGAPVAFAVAPRISAGTVIVFSNLQFALPVLVGLQLGEHELTLGPRVDVFRGSFIAEDSPTAAVWLAGGTVGFALKAGPLRLTPELGFTRPFIGSIAFGSEQESTVIQEGLWFFQPNLFVAVDIGPRD